MENKVIINLEEYLDLRDKVVYIDKAIDELHIIDNDGV